MSAFSTRLDQVSLYAARADNRSGMIAEALTQPPPIDDITSKRARLNGPTTRKTSTQTGSLLQGTPMPPAQEAGGRH
jgi:hypothetical protein